jgi:ATP-binding cassette, subfamily B, bacterial
VKIWTVPLPFSPVGISRRVIARLRQARASSGRLMAIRLLLDTSKGLTIVLAGWVLASAVLPNATLVAMGVVVGRVPGAAAHGLGSPDGHRLIAALVAAGVFFAATLLLGPLQSGLSSVVKARLTVAMQQRLMAAVSGPAGIAHLEDPGVLNRLARAQGSLISYYPGDAPVTLAGVIGTRLSGLIACGVLATFRWWLGLAVLVLWLLARQPLRRVVLRQVRSFGGNAEIMRRALYFMELAGRPAAAKEIRVYGSASWVVGQFRTHWLAGMAASWRSLARMHRVVLAVGWAVLLLYLGAAWVIGHAALRHEISLQVLTVMLLMLITSASVGTITFADIGLEFMVSALPDLHGLEAELGARAGALDGTRPAAGLPSADVRFENVTFAYPGAAAPVLRGLSLRLPAGRSTAIVGVNGAGKTTLVKLLCRLHDPTGGQITVDGVPLADLDPGAWQRQVAVVFQDFARYPLSLAENVGLGAHEHRHDAAGIERAVEMAGARAVLAGLPAGAKTTLSAQYEGGTDLSGGQWQRVALARALFAVQHGARMLVLDEPTASLDARGEAEFFTRFLEITKGVTTVVISHRFSTVRQAGQVCVISGGQVTEQGSHDDLVALGGTYASMFRLQAMRFTDERPPSDTDGKPS